MFALHETTQRRVCRVTFLVGCLLPTLVTLGWIAYSIRPWREADWQRSLSHRLHVRTQLEECSTPRPGVSVVENLRFADLRTSLPLGSITDLRIERKDSQLNLHAARIEIEAEQLPALAAAFEAWLTSDEVEALVLQADSLRIVGPTQQSVQFSNLSIRSEPATRDNIRWQVKAIDQMGETVACELVCAGSAIQFKLDTQQATIPAWLIGKWMPGVGGCGNATFAGVITTVSKNQQLEGQARGRLEQVDLNSWIGVSGPHHLQGHAQVQLEQLAWSERGIANIQGEMRARQGEASYSLLLEMRRLFTCNLGPAVQPFQAATPATMLPFDQLAFKFQLNSAGILLVGACADAAMICHKGQTMLHSPQVRKPFAVTEFVQLFHRAQRGWFPDTRSSLDMARVLPLPEDPKGTEAVQSK